jgi:diguanylate cyclase (GGDEF)-like protein
MSAAVYFTGWNSGFQVTLIGINFLVFYAYYVAKCLNIKAWNPVCTSLIGMSAYLIMCIVIYYHAPAYHLPEPVEFLLSIFWGANVFAITIFFLYTYTKLTSDSRELLTEEAGHDQLTGLANRYYMADYMRGIEEKYGLGGYWVAIADIDDFKKINDTCGHNCGDQVLVEMARLMSDFVKLYLSECEICRWGGEEFLLVGKGDEEKLDVEKLDSLRKMISRHDFRYENRHLDLTVTMGFAMFEGLSFKDGMELADKRLYTGKKSGKNKVVYG